jgi:hypothetical protein
MGLNVPSPDLAGAADPYFLSINDRPADKGFLVTTADELINWARTGSLMWMTFGLACRAVLAPPHGSASYSFTVMPNTYARCFLRKYSPVWSLTFLDIRLFPALVT